MKDNLHPELAAHLQTILSPQGLLNVRKEDGILHLSPPRAFFHDEETYTSLEGKEYSLLPGEGLLRLVSRLGADCRGPALEIGCGFGYLSLGLAVQHPYPLMLLTDASPSFLRILRTRLEQVGITGNRVELAVLSGEGLSHFADGSLSLVAMRATLHHLDDVDAFLAEAARVLKPNGALVFEEPGWEGLLIMGVLVSLMPDLARAQGEPATDEELKQVEIFQKMVEFYCRRDVNKSGAEDKHLFRPQEIIIQCRRHGFETMHYGNAALSSFACCETLPAPPPTFFHDSMRGYLVSVCGLGEGFGRLFDRTVAATCRYIDLCSRGGRGADYLSVYFSRKL